MDRFYKSPKGKRSAVTVIEKLRDILIKHEGLRLKPYRCTAGKITIGVGRNLEDLGISRLEAMYLLDNDIMRVWDEADEKFEWFEELGDDRKIVVVSMIFNLGMAGFLKFFNLIKAIETNDFNEASKQMLKSKWATQVGTRAQELAKMMAGYP